MIIMGCDPGQSGGIAVLGDKTLAAAYRMPETIRDLLDLLKEIGEVDHCYLEKVHSMPRQGVASSFKFGYNYGSLEAAIVCAGIPLTKITPQIWQRSLGCLSKGNKNVTKQRAQELFPGHKITHAIADAMLIAEFGRRIWMQREL